MTDHRETVGQMYEAFGRGDIPFLLERLAEGVRWEHWAAWSAHEAGVPWLRPRTGRAEVLEFFRIIGEWSFLDFRVLDLMASEHQVGAQVVVDIQFPSGRRHQDEELHVWTFDDVGQVTHFRHYLDTAKNIAATREA